MTNDHAPMTNEASAKRIWSLVLRHWDLSRSDHRRPAPTLDIVYQMRKQLCQLLFQQAENLFGAFQAAARGNLLQAERPVKNGRGPKIPHRTLDRMRRPVQQLAVGCVDRPPNFVDPPRMLLQKSLGDDAQELVVAATDFERRFP